MNIVVARSEHCGTMQGVLAVVVVCLGAVDSFTFPGDWHKIRQMMEARRDLQQLVGAAAAVSPSELCLERGGGGRAADTGQLDLQRGGRGGGGLGLLPVLHHDHHHAAPRPPAAAGGHAGPHGQDGCVGGTFEACTSDVQ